MPAERTPSGVSTDAVAVRATVVAAGLDAGDPVLGSRDAVPATDHEYRYDPERTVALLAGALARLHSLEVPGDAQPVLGPDDLVGRARDVVAGRRPARPPAPAYAHVEPSRLASILADGAAAQRDSGRAPVLTHGDPTLAALRCAHGAAVGFVGWDDAAVAHAERDLAVAAADIAASLGPMLVPVFFERYAEARPDAGPTDPVALDWYALAAQFRP